MFAPRSEALINAVRSRVVVADGAMGTMIQEANPTLDEFQGYEGCNEILNVTRPDIISGIHSQYLKAGAEAIETNTFGANFANLAEYDIQDRIEELAFAGAEVARQVADDFSTDEKPRWVLGSMGPGTKLPSLGHERFAVLRDAYQLSARGLIRGGADAILIETAQDLLQAKSAVIGSKRAMAELNVQIPILVSVTIETTGTMLLGSEIGAALTALSALGIDAIGLNCATGPTEMSEHLRYLAKFSDLPVVVMPNAGLPILGPHGAHYPLTPSELATAQLQFVNDYGAGLVGGCCGTTPAHIAEVAAAVAGKVPSRPQLIDEPGLASLYQHQPFDQTMTYLSIGERTNANGSKAFREAMLAENWDECLEIARSQTREGAHLLDVCVDYVGRDGAKDARELVSRLATSTTLPLVLDSTEPAVLEAGLECMGGRAMINSVNYEDGDGPTSRFARIMPMVREHGAAVVALTIDEEGQARTADTKFAIAKRLIEDLTTNWGMRLVDITVDTLTFPIATGQDETRRDGIETIEAIRRLHEAFPGVQSTLGISNISFGLSPAARHVLNSVFLQECVKVGLTSAIVHAARIMPLSQIPAEQLEAALDLIYDRRTYDADGNITFDPLTRFLDVFSGVDSAANRQSRAEELAAMPLDQRLERRIIDGEKKGLEPDLDEALASGMTALGIINDHLLKGMQVVGELFGKGEMQLPFVLQSAEVMKTAVAHLEPFIEKTEDAGKGRILLATVRGDVHDIGKNLVDIILSNNGFETVNIGIKQPINEILRAAEEHDVDVIGMSGLLVKSTQIMRENLEEMNLRGVAERWPVILGGAALTRSFVEQDLAEIFDGEVRYARDAFEGLRLMDTIIKIKRGDTDAKLPELKKRVVQPKNLLVRTVPDMMPDRSDVSSDNEIPSPPFWGTRIIKGVPLRDYASFLDERATFMGQWGLKPSRAEDGASYEELVETEGRPRLRAWLEKIQTESLLEAAVVYGYFPAVSDGDDLVILHHGPEGATDGGSGGIPGTERLRFTFPRQARDRHLCLSDYIASKESGKIDVVPFQLVTMGNRVSEAANELYAANDYRNYLELHGLSVQLTEALAEFWHARVREELGFSAEDPAEVEGNFRLEYRGARYSFGYPACPELEDRVKLVELLKPEAIGVTLSEELQLHPEQSTDAMVLHHPEAKYFSV
ncbi:methionine synthase [Rhodoluna sp. KAS3]|uniref:methionine synthase n=1 Tax=Rhodoluna sp. KAS3 TaxID=942880 RepID=UPI00222FA7F3|nr:methionine synthase [Rhodoluna sp. KAS3]BDS48971.1 methionine synthase [Rhodoluna sp. KAS3]